MHNSEGCREAGLMAGHGPSPDSLSLLAQTELQMCLALSGFFYLALSGLSYLCLLHPTNLLRSCSKQLQSLNSLGGPSLLTGPVVPPRPGWSKLEQDLAGGRVEVRSDHRPLVCPCWWWTVGLWHCDTTQTSLWDTENSDSCRRSDTGDSVIKQLAATKPFTHLICSPFPAQVSVAGTKGTINS